MTPPHKIPDDIQKLADLAAASAGYDDPVLVTAISAVLIRKRGRCRRIAEYCAAKRFPAPEIIRLISEGIEP